MKTATISRFVLGDLIAARKRSETGGALLLPLLLGLSAALGGWIGLDLRQVDVAKAADGLFFILLGVTAPLPVAAVGALYHDPLHAPLLPWPVSAANHFKLGLRLMLVRHLPWALFAAGLGAGAAWGESSSRQALFSAYALLCFVGAWLIGAGFAGLCGLVADSDREGIRAFRQSAAGPFASERHAPFFYFPAAAFAVTAIAASLSQVGLVHLVEARATPRAMMLFAAPALIGVLVFLLGAAAYRASALRTVARVIEEAKTVYGGRPAPADPPYGARLARLLPRVAAAYFSKELREQARAQRALWPGIVLALLLCAAYAANVGMPVNAAPVVAVVLMAWVSTLSTRRTPRQAGVPMLLTLPEHRGAAWLGRWLALVFVAAHLGLAVALTLHFRHGGTVGLWVALLAITVSAMATSATKARPALAANHFPLSARLAPPAALIVGLVGLASLSYGLPLAALFLLVAIFEVLRR